MDVVRVDLQGQGAPGDGLFKLFSALSDRGVRLQSCDLDTFRGVRVDLVCFLQAMLRGAQIFEFF